MWFTNFSHLLFMSLPFLIGENKNYISLPVCGHLKDNM